MTPEQVQPFLRDWFAARKTSSINFYENLYPSVDADSRYEVVYEARFEPNCNDQAYLEIWITATGEIAIGIERRIRIAERSGVKCARDGFAGGHEPFGIRATALHAILDAVANGEIAIFQNVVPIFGLASTNAATSKECHDRLISCGYYPIDWLHGEAMVDIADSRKFVKFRRWS